MNTSYNCYIVSYDLRQPGRNYNDLYEALKSFEGWGKLTESCWALITKRDSVEIRDILLKYIDANDRLFVMKGGKEAAWRTLIADNEWLQNNLKL